MVNSIGDLSPAPTILPTPLPVPTTVSSVTADTSSPGHGSLENVRWCRNGEPDREPCRECEREGLIVSASLIARESELLWLSMLAAESLDAIAESEGRSSVPSAVGDTAFMSIDCRCPLREVVDWLVDDLPSCVDVCRECVGEGAGLFSRDLLI